MVVNTESVIASGVADKYGINLNAGLDADANRPAGARPLAQAVQEMGAKRLRFPGGAKSNFYVWAAAPYTSAATAHWVPGSYYAGASRNTMNTDQLMATCRQTGAQAHINVAYNPAAGLDQQVAAAWVRYANITKGYGIKYWEVGNEMWNDKGLSAAQAADIASRYAAAMKAVDPSIKVGISWNSQAGFQTIVNAAPNIDFVACSNYTTAWYGAYSTYATTPDIDLLPDARAALNAVGSSGKSVVVSEFNAINWYQGWGKTNDLGHALVNFETIGQLLTTPRIDYGALWNTRWFGEEWDGFSLYTALNRANGLHASGMALAVWGKFIQDQLVRTTSSPTVKTFAAYDASTGTLNVFLENKAEQAQRVAVPIRSSNAYGATAAVWQLTGSGSWDQTPTWAAAAPVRVAGNTIPEINLPAVSVTVVSLTKAGAGPVATTRVANGGFETGTLAPWATWLNGGEAGLTTSTTRAGSQAGWAGGGLAYLYQVVQGLQPNTTYTLTCDVAAYSSSGATAWVGVKNTGTTEQYQEVGDTNGGWRTVSFTFTTGSSQTSAEIYLWNTDASTWAWIDEVRLTDGSSAARQLSAVAADQRAAPPLANAQLTVFPNPFRSTFTYELPEPHTLQEVQLLDLRGAEVSGVLVQQGGRQGRITPPASLPAGLYLLRLTTPQGKTTVHKVVKQ
ncbi:T9SS type A sorting domain-containing protein [Hymenobacter sp. BT683]|uniref:T9SS type A sorting domain-containing protein n=1 Tax=Hymenobacter jeongseonensis TaxID=2791027 RepID=A0ABS0ILR5_9BACT|nr:carbohydrate binding domain-containing protein [Hymenobacter jeongseonensis]MBF9239305.1 T9SS type A sorting domain-containing protein [Hymenobacter jeongseonensis]